MCSLSTVTSTQIKTGEREYFPTWTPLGTPVASTTSKVIWLVIDLVYKSVSMNIYTIKMVTIFKVANIFFYYFSFDIPPKFP